MGNYQTDELLFFHWWVNITDNNSYDDISKIAIDYNNYRAGLTIDEAERLLQEVQNVTDEEQLPE